MPLRDRVFATFFYVFAVFGVVSCDAGESGSVDLLIPSTDEDRWADECATVVAPTFCCSGMIDLRIVKSAPEDSCRGLRRRGLPETLAINTIRACAEASADPCDLRSNLAAPDHLCWGYRNENMSPVDMNAIDCDALADASGPAL